MTETTDTQNDEKYIWLSKSEYDDLIKQVNGFSNYQRLSSLILIIAIIMVFLHIAVDIFFNLLAKN